MNSFWDWLKTHDAQTLMAGGAGATVAACHKWPGLVAFLRIIVVGTFTAYYVGDYAAPIFKWLAGVSDLSVDKAPYSGAFLIGATGTVLIETILLAVSLRKHELSKSGEQHGNEPESHD